MHVQGAQQPAPPAPPVIILKIINANHVHLEPTAPEEPPNQNTATPTMKNATPATQQPAPNAMKAMR